MPPSPFTSTSSSSPSTSPAGTASTAAPRPRRAGLIIIGVGIAVVLAVTLTLVVRAEQTRANLPPAEYAVTTSPQGSPLMPSDNLPSNSAVVKEIERVFNSGKPIAAFDPNRTVAQLSQCARWQQPASPDPASASWYRAATSLNTAVMHTSHEYQQMLMLFEAAARRGDYRATKDLTIVYTEGSIVKGGMRFKPEWRKARMWINEGLRRQWPGAIEWVADAMLNGKAGFQRDEKLGLALMQFASDLGVPLAQYQLGLYYGNSLMQVEKEEALLACAAAQNLSPALYDTAAYKKIEHHPQEALELYQRSVMAGGTSGCEAAFALYGAFTKDSGAPFDLQVAPDETRKNAYRDIYNATDKKNNGNFYMTFPRLNEVLPLPPAKVTEWKGIYSAMSPDDAAYYQNPPPPEFYLKDIRAAGYLITDDYLSQPVPDPQFANMP